MTNHILVTTLDINREYDIIGPVFFEVTDAGGFFSQQLEELMERYRAEIAALRRRGATGARTWSTSACSHRWAGFRPVCGSGSISVPRRW